MDRATQQNAAMVEEAAGASQSLQERATGLADLVAVFRLGGGGQVWPQQHLQLCAAPRTRTAA
jgi:hypothetical protein